MASAYPGAIDALATNKANSTPAINDHPAHHNDMADAINKIEGELGVNPSGASATVAALLSAHETKLTGLHTGQVYTVTNGAVRRTIDANSFTMEQLMDLVSTLIVDLRAADVIE